MTIGPQVLWYEGLVTVPSLSLFIFSCFVLLLILLLLPLPFE